MVFMAWMNTATCSIERRLSLRWSLLFPRLGVQENSERTWEDMPFFGVSRAVVPCSASGAAERWGLLGAHLCWSQKLEENLFKAALPLKIILVQLLYLILGQLPLACRVHVIAAEARNYFNTWEKHRTNLSKYTVCELIKGIRTLLLTQAVPDLLCWDWWKRWLL